MGDTTHAFPDVFFRIGIRMIGNEHQPIEPVSPRKAKPLAMPTVDTRVAVQSNVFSNTWIRQLWVQLLHQSNPDHLGKDIELCLTQKRRVPDLLIDEWKKLVLGFKLLRTGLRS